MLLFRDRSKITFLFVFCLIFQSVIDCFRWTASKEFLRNPSIGWTMADRKKFANTVLSGTTSSNVENAASVSLKHDVSEVSVQEPPTKRIKLLPTLRSMESSIAALAPVEESTTSSKDNALRQMQQYTASMNARVKAMEPFTEDEIRTIVQSLQNVIPVVDAATSDEWPGSSLAETLLQELQDSYLPSFAHLSHKNWTTTGNNAERLNQLLFPDAITWVQRHMFERIFREGNWDGAVTAATKNPTAKPWAVLVTVSRKMRVPLDLPKCGPHHDEI
jgi:hypothetical protein